MVALAVRSGTFSRTPPPRHEVAAERREEWHGIYRAGQKIGYSHRTRTPTADGFAIDSDTSLWLALMGSAQAVHTRLTADTDRTLTLRRFDFRLRSGTIDFQVGGKVHDGVVDLESATLGKQTIRVPPNVPLALSETVADFLGGEKLESGRSFEYTVFDPASAAPAPISLEVGPLERVDLPSGERSAYRIDQRFQGTTVHMWVDADGAVLKEEGPLGLAIVREIDGKAAMSGVGAGPGADLSSAAAIPVTRAIPSPRDTAHLRIRIARAPSSATLQFPPRQRRDGDQVLVERQQPGTFRSYSLPETDERFRDDLRATPFLQIDDPAIRRAAEQAVAGKNDAESAARALVDWVHRSLAKVPTISVPNAKQVLAERRGDCNEHAVLFAALARAAAIPTRSPRARSTCRPTAGRGVLLSRVGRGVARRLGERRRRCSVRFPADATHVKLRRGRTGERSRARGNDRRDRDRGWRISDDRARRALQALRRVHRRRRPRRSRSRRARCSASSARTAPARRRRSA